MTDRPGVVLTRPDGVILVLDAIPVSAQEQRDLDAVLDALGVPRRPSADTGTQEPAP